MQDGRFKKKNQRGKGINTEKRRPQVGGAGLGFSQTASNTAPPSMSQPFDNFGDPPPIVQATKPLIPPAVNPSVPVAFPIQDDALRSYHAGMFRTQFVRSGTAGGDLDNTPTVVAPKVASSRPVPPPPTPVTEKPIVTTPQPPLPIRRLVSLVCIEKQAMQVCGDLDILLSILRSCIADMCSWHNTLHIWSAW